MEELEYARTPQERLFESWEIFKTTGDIYDAMEFLHDFEALNNALGKEEYPEME